MTQGHRLHAHTIGLVAVGSALGASARYGLSVWFPDAGSGFQWTTFAINVVLTVVPALALCWLGF